MWNFVLKSAALAIFPKVIDRLLGQESSRGSATNASNDARRGALGKAHTPALSYTSMRSTDIHQSNTPYSIGNAVPDVQYAAHEYPRDVYNDEDRVQLRYQQPRPSVYEYVTED